MVVSQHKGLQRLIMLHCAMPPSPSIKMLRRTIADFERLWAVNLLRRMRFIAAQY
jgi:hypothetical protein